MNEGIKVDTCKPCKESACKIMSELVYKKKWSARAASKIAAENTPFTPAQLRNIFLRMVADNGSDEPLGKFDLPLGTDPQDGKESRRLKREISAHRTFIKTFENHVNKCHEPKNKEILEQALEIIQGY